MTCLAPANSCLILGQKRRPVTVFAMSVEFQKNGAPYVTVRAKGNRRILRANDPGP
mgnify:CR=1 FL=1